MRETGIARLTSFDLDIKNDDFLCYRRLFPDLRKASLHAHGVLLDIGCGNKPYEGMFDGRVTRYIGCDAAQSSNSRADVISSATELPFKDASCDTVLITQVIEHVADHRTLLREAFRILRGKGVLILSGPMYWELHEEPYDFFRFTEHGLRFLLEDSRFAGIEIVNNGGKWALCGLVVIHTIRATRLHHEFLIHAINRIFAYLDDRYPSRTSTINYVAVARKPENA